MKQSSFMVAINLLMYFPEVNVIILIVFKSLLLPAVSLVFEQDTPNGIILVSAVFFVLEPLRGAVGS